MHLHEQRRGENERTAGQLRRGESVVQDDIARKRAENRLKRQHHGRQRRARARLPEVLERIGDAAGKDSAINERKPGFKEPPRGQSRRFARQKQKRRAQDGARQELDGAHHQHVAPLREIVDRHHLHRKEEGAENRPGLALPDLPEIPPRRFARQADEIGSTKRRGRAHAYAAMAAKSGTPQQKPAQTERRALAGRSAAESAVFRRAPARRRTQMQTSRNPPPRMFLKTVMPNGPSSEAPYFCARNAVPQMKVVRRSSSGPMGRNQESGAEPGFRRASTNFISPSVAKSRTSAMPSASQTFPARGATI